MGDMLVRSKIKLNLLHPNSGVVVYAKQFDKDSRVIDIDLVAGSEVWDPPHDCEVVVMYAKPDGTKGIYDILEDNETRAVVFTGIGSVRLTLAEQALSVAGNVFFEISFYTAELRSTTLSFILSVESGVPKNEDLVSESYFNILSELIQGLIGATTHPPQIDPTTKNWLIWVEGHNQYEDSGYSSIGEVGPMNGIEQTVVEYVKSSSGVIIPTAGWDIAMPQPEAGKYIWTRVIVDFDDGNGYVYYSVAYQGQDGEGAPGSALPSDLAPTASVGDAIAYSREDHVHKLPDAEDLLYATYPVGSRYYSENSSADPATILGGTWDQDTGFVEFMSDDVDSLYNGLSITSIDITLPSISANGTESGTINLNSGAYSRDGYTPLGVVGFGTGGSGSSVIVPVRVYVSDSVTVSWLVRNTANVATSGTSQILHVQVLWKKNPPTNRRSVYSWTRTA